MDNESSNLVIDPFLGSNDDIKLILRVLKSLRSLLTTTTKSYKNYKKKSIERFVHGGDLLILLNMKIFLDFDIKMKTSFFIFCTRTRE
jgi:hypothetical protein